MDGLWSALALAESRCNAELETVMAAIRAYQRNENPDWPAMAERNRRVA